MVVIAALAAINVNLAFNSEESVIDLSLTSIMALARGETDICSICGKMLTLVIADLGITCSEVVVGERCAIRILKIGFVPVRQMGILILFVYNIQ